MLFEGQIRRGKAVPAPKPDRRGAARRAARRRGLEHISAACALPAGRLAHVHTLGKAALYARRVVRCVLLCTARAAVSRPPHRKARLDGAAESARLSSHGKLCVSLFHERAHPADASDAGISPATDGRFRLVLQPEERLYGKVPRKGIPRCHWDNRRLRLACELRAALLSGRQHEDALFAAGAFLCAKRYSLVHPRYPADAVRAGMALRPSPHAAETGKPEESAVRSSYRAASLSGLCALGRVAGRISARRR